jgi:hypothetical protein
VFRILQANAAGAALIALCWSTPAYATTFVPSQTFRAGTRIACVLDKSMNSANLKYGDEFELRVVDTSHPALVGARILGYITEVTQPSGLSRAKVTFFLTAIRLPNGTKKPITAFVLNKGVVPYNPAAQQAARAQLAAPPMPNGFTTPGPVAWQMTIGGSSGSGGGVTIANRTTGTAGGTVYARNAREPIIVPAGTSVTVELQQPLTIP